MPINLSVLWDRDGSPTNVMGVCIEGRYYAKSPRGNWWLVCMDPNGVCIPCYMLTHPINHPEPDLP